MERERTDEIDIFSLYMKDLKKSRRLTLEEERDLLGKAALGDMEAKKKVIESNLKLVLGVARRFAHNGLQLTDLVGEGNVGLLVAAEKFNLEKRASFATYAAYRVLQNIVRAAYQQTDLVRKPAYVWERSRKLNKISNAFANENGREPTVEEISSLLSVSLKSLKNIINAKLGCVAGNPYVDIENVSDCPDSVQDNPLEILITREEEINNVKKVNEALSGLSEREKQIIMMRFGFNGYQPSTLQDIGKKIGITRQRVQQLEKRIVKRLKDVLKEERIAVCA